MWFAFDLESTKLFFILMVITTNRPDGLQVDWIGIADIKMIAAHKNLLFLLNLIGMVSNDMDMICLHSLNDFLYDCVAE